MQTKTFLLLTISIMLLACGTAANIQLQSAGEISQGALLTVDDAGNKLQLPLKHTEVSAEITGLFAQVEVVQEFGNPFKKPIEAVYVFPLPQNSAVNEMVMQIGKREILGVVKKRAEARKMYEQAKAVGKTASLLEQERPNIFTQSIANILPNDRIKISIKYFYDLKYDNGIYEFVFPMVVGPRFIPGDATGKQAKGWSDDTDIVPDASKITPPVLKPKQRSGHDISLNLRLNTGLHAKDIKSPSHKINIKKLPENEVFVSIAQADNIPNKDFILRYKVKSKKTEIAALTHADEQGKYLMMLIQPKADFSGRRITPKEMVFVVDNSGSMNGFPIEKAKEVMRQCIHNLNSFDKFQIYHFSNDVSKLSPKSLSNNTTNKLKALNYINKFSGNGGTQMLKAVHAAIQAPSDPKRTRIILFITDGLIGNETEILSAIETQLSKGQLFSLGIGSSPNRYLLERMAEVGHGFALYLRDDENTDQAINNFFSRISKPYMKNISIDWKDLGIKEMYPRSIPDLFSNQPLSIFARYEKAGNDTILLTADIDGKQIKIEQAIDLLKKNTHNSVIAKIWARKKIKYLMSLMYSIEISEIVDQVTDLAIKYNLMSKYTSFIAVEEQIRNIDGKQETIMVPVELPDRMNYEGVFGKERILDSATFGNIAPMSASRITIVSEAPLMLMESTVDMKSRGISKNIKENGQKTVEFGGTLKNMWVKNSDIVPIIVNWMKANASSLGKIVSFKLRYQPGDLTAYTNLKIGGESYKLFLLYKENKKQLNIILIELDKHLYYYFPEFNGFSRSIIYEEGIFKIKSDRKEIINFTGRKKTMSKKISEKVNNILYAWINSIKTNSPKK